MVVKRWHVCYVAPLTEIDIFFTEQLLKKVVTIVITQPRQLTSLTFHD